MSEHILGRLLGFSLVPILWGVILGLVLWVCRRWFPRAEPVLFGSVTGLLRRLIRSVRASRRT